MKLNWLNEQSRLVHQKNIEAGWWDNKTVDSAFCEKLVLIHSELSEALEGYRKGLQDSHLSHRSAVEVEFADVLIRLFDLAGAMKLDLDGSYKEKMEYNQHRQDHKIENRLAQGGKKF